MAIPLVWAAVAGVVGLLALNSSSTSPASGGGGGQGGNPAPPTPPAEDPPGPDASGEDVAAFIANERVWIAWGLESMDNVIQLIKGNPAWKSSMLALAEAHRRAMQTYEGESDDYIASHATAISVLHTVEGWAKKLSISPEEYYARWEAVNQASMDAYLKATGQEGGGATDLETKCAKKARLAQAGLQSTLGIVEGVLGIAAPAASSAFGLGEETGEKVADGLTFSDDIYQAAYADCLNG